MKEFRVTVNGQTYNVLVEELSDGNTAFKTENSVLPSPATPPALAHIVAQEQLNPRTQQGENTVTAPMPGVVQKIFVAGGQSVHKGEVLLILEAMKMENEILAPQAGTVKTVQVTEGATVNTGDILVIFA
ncbi:MAG: biotin/lipoyl-binding protein [Firmicutes bacterium]|nr:biotin/lipoyl-binding protein [Bacillota bacterium]